MINPIRTALAGIIVLAVGTGIAEAQHNRRGGMVGNRGGAARPGMSGAPSFSPPASRPGAGGVNRPPNLNPGNQARPGPPQAGGSNRPNPGGTPGPANRPRPVVSPVTDLEPEIDPREEGRRAAAILDLLNVLPAQESAAIGLAQESATIGPVAIGPAQESATIGPVAIGPVADSSATVRDPDRIVLVRGTTLASSTGPTAAIPSSTGPTAATPLSIGPTAATPLSIGRPISTRTSRTTMSQTSLRIA